MQILEDEYQIEALEEAEIEEECSKDETKKSNDDNLQIRIDALEKINLELAKLADEYQSDNDALKSELEAMKLALHKWFTPAQIKVLIYDAKGPKWDDDALQKSMTIIANAGERNLELVRKYIPLPSSATTYRHLSKFSKFFTTGFLHLNAHMMGKKYESLDLLPSQHYLAIGFDAKQIVSGIQINPSTKERTGIATIDPTLKVLEKNPQKLASHAVIFLAMGLDPRIKEVVGYELSTDSCDPESMKEKLFNVIKQTEEVTGQKVRLRIA
jgi:hypothetical protein